MTDSRGAFALIQLPPNNYHVSVAAASFAPIERDVDVRSSVPVRIELRLELASQRQAVRVESPMADLLENVTYAHYDVDRSAMRRLPAVTPASGLSDAITLSVPGVVADSNGFFHPQGDHAQASFIIDGQPITDQQSKQFSTQYPLNALQSMEVVTGGANAEYGEKTSLVIDAQTRSGLESRMSGSLEAYYGSFGTFGEQATFGGGTAKLGNFLAVNAGRSGRFLDTPEFRPRHAIGNSQTIFDRLDWRPTERDAFRLNLFGARNWFQVPTTDEQPEQDQRQKVTTFSVAPGYTRSLGSNALISVNPFFRQDRVNYYPSGDVQADTPLTVSQNRHLTNYGARADFSWVRGRHNIKTGVYTTQTRLKENFSFGITDEDFVDEDEQPGLVPYDLTRGGEMFRFSGRATIRQYSWYGQDTIRIGNLTLNAGIRFDDYRGLSESSQWQPRTGISYLIVRTGTVLRYAFSQSMETPYNENLVLSSATGSGGLAQNVFGAFGSEPLRPGRRTQHNVGLQQAISRYVQVDADYFWKQTTNAYDFGALLDTPIFFPLSLRLSKIDGLGVRVATRDIRGFQANILMGHSRSRFFGPSTGGLIFNSPLETGVFRIDHDQAFQQTSQLRYQPKGRLPWIAFTWRYDSGMVAGAAAEDNPGEGVIVPAEDEINDDHNPPRIAPRHLFSIGAGHDNIFRADRYQTSIRFTAVNLTNRVAFYNYLSTFAGTHYVTPRAYTFELGFRF